MNNVDKYVKKIEKDLKNLENEKFKSKHKKGIRNLKIIGFCTLFAVLTTGYTVGATTITNSLNGTDSLFDNRISVKMVTEYNYDSLGNSFQTVVKDNEDSEKHVITIYGKAENGKRLCSTLRVDILDLKLVEAVRNCDYEYINYYIEKNTLTDIIDSTIDYDGGYIVISEHDRTNTITLTRDADIGEKIIKYLFFFILIGCGAFFTSIIFKNDYSYPSIWNKVIDIIQNTDLDETNIEALDKLIESKKEELRLFKGK